MSKKKSLILIVDDVSVNRMTIKLSLRDGEYDFLEASNGQEAIDLALTHNPDVILIDAMMPVMDGYEATRRLREIEKTSRTPILMITSLEDKDDKIRAIDIGVNDFITKPFDKSELQTRCKSYAQISNLNKKYSLATINSVTKLPNKLSLQKDISLHEESQLFLIKIENFDENENFYGQKIVVNLEKEFSNILKKYFKYINYHKIYHIANGKYAILLNRYHNISDEKAKDLCFNFIEMVKNKNIEAGGNIFNVNIVMSFASYSQTLYEDANAVLNFAISNKKDFLISSDVITDIRKTLKINLDMLNTIKYALKNRKFIPHYQPIFDNKTKKISKYETLIRVLDENQNIIYPGPYMLEVAKKGKLYTQITKIILENIWSIIRENNKEFSINLSSLDIEDPNMSAYLLDSVKSNKDLANKLIFELLEDKDTEDYELVKNFIDTVKGYGVKIAIDDFGSGYSNFMRVLEFEPDIIKIDGSLVKDIATDKNARNTVEMIKIFADRIGAKTVAEYVENKEIYDIINEIGIDFSQGFYIAKATEELLIKKELEELVNLV